MSRPADAVRVEMPLALPAIIAGLRIATVSTIALATIAALIVNQGLGVPILSAISNYDVQDRADRRRRAGGAAGDRRRRRCWSALQRLLTPWVADGPRTAPLSDGYGTTLITNFVDAFKFIGRNGETAGRSRTSRRWPTTRSGR